MQRAQRARQTVPSGGIKRGIPGEVSPELNFSSFLAKTGIDKATYQ